MRRVVIAIAAPPAVLGGAKVFIITRDEMDHHLDHRRAATEPADAAIATAVFFAALTVSAGPAAAGRTRKTLNAAVAPGQMTRNAEL